VAAQVRDEAAGPLFGEERPGSPDLDHVTRAGDLETSRAPGTMWRSRYAHLTPNAASPSPDEQRRYGKGAQPRPGRRQVGRAEGGPRAAAGALGLRAPRARAGRRVRARILGALDEMAVVIARAGDPEAAAPGTRKRPRRGPGSGHGGGPRSGGGAAAPPA